MMLIWLGLFLVFLVLEIMTVSLVSLWFCLGAFIGGILCSLGASLPIQIMGFVLGTALGLSVLYPISKKALKPKETNAHSLIGAEGIVVKSISPLDFSGQVKVKNQLWSAMAEEEIEIGAHVIVEEIEGVHLRVRRV